MSSWIYRGSKLADLGLSHCLILLMLFLSNCVEGSEVIELTSAQFIVDNSKRPPNQIANWQPIELPYITSGTPFAERPKVTWFRFAVDAPSEFSAVYIYRFQARASVFLNAYLVGGNLTPRGRMSTEWNHPLLVNLPAEGWRVSNNYLYIRLVGDDLGPLMAPPVFGSQLLLHEQWQNRMFWQVQTAKMSFALCVFLAMLTFWFWRLNPTDQLYLKFTGACISWAIVNVYLFVTDYPIGLSSLLVLIHGAIDFACFFFMAFINQSVNLRADRVEKTMLAICLIAAVSYIVVPLDYFLYVAYGTHILNLGILLYTFVRALNVIFRDFNPTRAWIPLAFVGILLLGMHDVYVFLLTDSENWIKASHVSQFTAPLILVCLFAQLGQRFIRALKDVETLNLELEDRVLEKRRELEGIYQKNREVELKRSALLEREKIYRDLHDDVGSKLVSIIQSPSTEKSPTLARAALESLRVAIFRAKYPELDLSSLLSDCKEETRIRAEAIRQEFTWDQNRDPVGITLESSTSYHLIRIFREAITNALHQGTDQPFAIRIAIGKTLHFRLENRSRSSDMAVSRFGNGLANIQFRASEISAKVDWHKEDELMVFELWLPIQGIEKVHVDSVNRHPDDELRK